MGDNDGIKHMPLLEFTEEGFLQEANRLFFHPRGLALALVVTSADNPTDTCGSYLTVWDCRDDPEGVIFKPEHIDTGKIDRVRREFAQHLEARIKLFGDHIQDVL